jgi:asparagine synthase (glutamine-hydrolysing)
MSGIAGVVNVDGAPVDVGVIESLLDAMARRGPDRRRGWRKREAVLGQALLATTPEAAAEMQPWIDPSTGCVAVSDSRLDNRPELLHALDLTHRPPDEIGDGELLHAAWRRWGDSCADRLLGDFAFAIWDPSQRRLCCARDVMGVRPFYYHWAPGRWFAFASEADALVAIPQVPEDLDEGRIADALVSELEGIDATSTFYRAVVRLPPAHTLVLDGGRLHQRRYWDPLLRQPRGLPRSEGEWVEAVRSELLRSVRRRLRGLDRVGSMLSGGLDSSSVAALASLVLSEAGRDRLATFSAVSSGESCAETSASAAVIRALDTDATLVDVGSVAELVPALRELAHQLGEPFDGTMTMVSAVYRAAAARGVRSLLDGMPGDNLYATGGHVYHQARHLRWVSAHRAAVEIHRAAGRRAPRLRAARSVAAACAPAVVRRLLGRPALRRFFERDLIAATLIEPGFARRVRLWDRYLRYRDGMTRSLQSDPSGQALTGMTAAYITAAVERYGRVAAMHGVEPRHPFLDRQLIELHAWLPVPFRYRNGWHKWILRQAMRHDLPAEVAWRSGRDHLGLQFSMAVMGPLFDESQTTLELERACAGRVDSGKLRAAEQAWREARDSESFNALHFAGMVAWFLTVRDPRPAGRGPNPS